MATDSEAKHQRGAPGFPRLRVIDQGTRDALFWIISDAIDSSNERRPHLEADDAAVEHGDLTRAVNLLPAKERALLTKQLD